MNNKTVTRMILVTWIILLCCFIFKIFSNGLFEIMVTNENFIAIADKLNSNIWLQVLASLPYVLVGNTLIILATIGEKSKSKKVVFITISAVLVEYFVKALFIYFLPAQSTIINFAIDTAFLVLFPYIFNRDYKICIASYLINLGMQSVSLLVRNIGIKIIVADAISGIILSFDVILMYVLYYLYRTFKKGV